jgi:hypothetical protein
VFKGTVGRGGYPVVHLFSVAFLDRRLWGIFLCLKVHVQGRDLMWLLANLFQPSPLPPISLPRLWWYACASNGAGEGSKLTPSFPAHLFQPSPLPPISLPMLWWYACASNGAGEGSKLTPPFSCPFISALSPAPNIPAHAMEVCMRR